MEAFHMYREESGHAVMFAEKDFIGALSAEDMGPGGQPAGLWTRSDTDGSPSKCLFHPSIFEFF